MIIATTIQQITGVMAVIALLAIVLGAIKVRNDERKKLFTKLGTPIIEAPAVKAQLDVISARARKRRSDFGVKRPRKPLESSDAQVDNGPQNGHDHV